jgi:quercetin dioxygenase-like cupin family protein
LIGSGSSTDSSPAGDGEVVVTSLWQTSRTDPAGSDPATRGEGFDVECPPDGTRWRIVEMGPHRTAPMHSTGTVDYDVVLDGEIELLLEAGAVWLRKGDTAVLPGVVHGWKTYDIGCRMAVTQVAIAGTRG